MTSEITERAYRLNTLGKFVVLLAGARQCEPVPGMVHLQKEMYLLQKLFPELAGQAGYEPRLGPHSKMVREEAERLESSGLISRDGSRFELTGDGRTAFDGLKSEMPGELEKAEDFKELLNDLSERELMALVYFSGPVKGLENEAPEYTDLARQRARLAMSMYQKDKISAQKAAQIAGMYLGDFIDDVKTYKNF